MLVYEFFKDIDDGACERALGGVQGVWTCRRLWLCIVDASNSTSRLDVSLS